MSPADIHILSLHLSLLLISDYSAAADVVVYDEPSGVPLVLTCRSDPTQGSVSYAAWTFVNQVVAFSGQSSCTSKYCINNTSLYDLIIANVSRADTGEYGCTIYYNGNGQPTVVRSLTLTVRDLPGLPSISQSALDMIEGRISMVTCQSLGGYPAPNITWYKGGVLQQSNVSATSNSSGDVIGIISFVPSYLDDGASLTCVANNILGSNSSTAFLNVSYGSRNVLLRSSAASIVEGSDIMLTCSAQGKPLPSISWTAPNTSGSTIQLNNTIGGVSYLYVSHIQRQAAGIYICTTSNFVNQLLNLNISSNITLDVKYIPSKPIVYPSSVNISSGDNISLICNVSDPGNPAALYNWTQNGLTIRTGLSTGVLIMPFVNLTSSGAYVCTVYNTAGPAASEMCNISVFAKPVIARGPATTVGYFGKPITLACSAYGNPLPTITWTKNMSTYSSWNVTTISSSIFTVKSFLLIASLRQDGYGTYICFANSQYGNDSSSIDVIAPSPPLPPSNVSEVAARWSTMVLSWAASYNGGYEQEFQVHVNLTLVYNGSSTSCTVTGLSSGSYFVYVEAKNYVGKSNSSEVVVVTLLDGPPAGSLSFSTPWSLPFHADAEYCVEVNCSYADSQSSMSANNCTLTSANVAQSIQCPAARARWCLVNFQDIVCGAYADLTRTTGTQNSQTKLTQDNVIIIACVVVGSVLLIVIVITAACYVRRRGRKKGPPGSLMYSTHDFSQSGAVLNANEPPYASYVRDQLYANPNFIGEGEDDLSHDGTQIHDQDLPNNNPQRHDYTYASVGVKRQPAPITASAAKGIPGYNFDDIDELDGFQRDDSSSVSEPPPYHPQVSVAESDATSATDSKQAKRVLYEVIV